MSIEAGLDSWLKANMASWLWFPQVVPQTRRARQNDQVWQAATYALIDTFPTHTLDHGSVVIQARFQFNFFSFSYLTVSSGVSSLRSSISGYRGLMGSVQVLGCYEETVGDAYDFPENASDKGIHQKHMDVFINFIP